jgi:hypothetical protein
VADVEVTLGARNEASAVLRQFSSEVTQTAQQVEFSIRGLAQLAGVTAAVIGVVEAGRAIVGFASSSVAAFDDLNRSAIKLSETVALIPNGSRQAADEMQKVANSLERMTNVDSGRIQDQMAQALRRGAGVSDIEDMAEAALGLSRVFDRDLSSAMRMVEDAVNGSFDAFKGLIPNIDQLATNEEKLAAVSELATKGLLNKAESAKSALEASDALKVATKNLYESFGALLAPIRDVVYRGFVVAFEFITNNLLPSMDEAKNVGQDLADALASIGESVATAFITGFTAAETAVMRFTDVLEVAKTFIVLQTESIINDVKFGFDKLLEFGSWFGDSWSKLMQSAIFEGPKYTFGDVMKDMPTIGQRTITATEMALQAMLDESLSGLTEGFDEKIRERLQALQDAMKLDIDIDLKPREGAANALRDQLRSLTAFESRVLVRGQTDSPIAKLVENSSKQVEEQKRTNAILDAANRSPSDEVRIEFVK